MEQLAKSALRFSWAMSLFGLKQMTEVLVPGRAGSVAQAFDPITKATTDTFGTPLRSTFQIGDAVQRGAVDLFFGVLSGRGFDFSSFYSPEARDQAAQADRQRAEAAAAGTTDQGWGPIPSPR